MLKSAHLLQNPEGRASGESNKRQKESGSKRAYRPAKSSSSTRHWLRETPGSATSVGDSSAHAFCQISGKYYKRSATKHRNRKTQRTTGPVPIPNVEDRLKMLEIKCEGTAREIGIQHGTATTKQINGSITFYAGLFKKYTGKEWNDVLLIAQNFGAHIQQKWPRYYDEIEGIACGAGRNVLDIVALNVRTEIAFGLLGKSGRSDGCTTVAWQSRDGCILGQNWDWMMEQKDNVLLLTIIEDGLPIKKMVTEAGIIGKIGLNAAGVGVCLNAIRARGLDETRLPVHLALRVALDATSAEDAARVLEENGVGGAAHILVADCNTAVGLEFTSDRCIRLRADEQGRILHTNHLLELRQNVDESPEIDSFARMRRMQALTDGALPMPLDEFARLFDDHEGFPVSICRSQEGASEDATVFNIVMDLGRKYGEVRLGRPCHVESRHVLSFEEYE